MPKYYRQEVMDAILKVLENSQALPIGKVFDLIAPILIPASTWKEPYKLMEELDKLFNEMRDAHWELLATHKADLTSLRYIFLIKDK